jgi:hypothetical protein
MGSVGHWNVRMTAFIYVFSIWVVATTLFVAVNNIEPNRHFALALKLLIVFVSAAAIAGRLMP